MGYGALLILLSLLLFSCSKKELPDTLPLYEITDKEDNDTFDKPQDATGLVISGYFHDKNEASDRDYYLLHFDRENNTAYTVIQTAVPGIDSVLTFYSLKRKMLFRIDEKSTGESEKLWTFYPPAEKVILCVEAKTGNNEGNPYIINFVSKEKDKFEEIEPNNTIKEAIDIKIGQSKKAYITPRNDVDYFHITTGGFGGDSISDFLIEVETFSNLDINFMIIDNKSGASKFVNFASWGAKEQFLYLASNKGDYYLKINGNTNSDTQKDPLYYISVSEQEAPDEDVIFEREFNDSFESATMLINQTEIEGSITANDKDYFIFDLTYDAETITLSLSRFQGEKGRIEIYDADRQLVSGNTGKSNITLRDISKGRYYILFTQEGKTNSLYRLFLNIEYK